MKKLLTLVLGLLLVFGLAGCNGDGSDINMNMNEFIEAPTNLSISGDELSWDAVTEANGYIVYINDKEVKKVGDDVTTYDFSSQEGDVLVFQVRTRAPRGMQDSPLSAKVAYVVNRTQEIAEVTTILNSSSMPTGPGFAEELVNKGMVSEDVENMTDGIDDFQTAIQAATTYEEYLAAINSFLETVDNIEALVSAFVKTYLIEYVEDRVEDIQDDLDYGYVYDRDATEQELLAYQELLDELNTNPDKIVLSLTTTIEYFLSIEGLVSEDLVGLIQNIAETDNVEDLNVDEVYEVKQEIVSILNDSMPSQEQMNLLIEVVDLLQAITGAGLENYDSVENYKGKLAASTLYQIEIFINFLDVFNKSDIQDLVDNATSEELTEPMIGAENAIVLVKIFNRFYDDNQNLFDTLDNVFTAEEKELIYEDSLSGLSTFTPDGDIDLETTTALFSSIDFQSLLKLQAIYKDGFSEMLDELVDTDGQIIREVVIMNSYTRYRSDWNDPYTFENEALDETYTATEYYRAKDVTQYKVAQEFVGILNALVQSFDEDDMNDVSTLLVNQIFEGLVLNMFSELSGAPFTQAQALDALEVVDSALTEANPDILKFVKNAVKYLVDNEVFIKYDEMLEDYHLYMQDEYGNQYMDEYGNHEYSDFKENASLIFYAKHYVKFMNNSNRGLLNSILDEVFLAMKENDIKVISNITNSQVDQLDTAIGILLDTIKDEFNRIDGYNYNNLSENNLTAMEEAQTEIMEAAQAIAEILIPVQ